MNTNTLFNLTNNQNGSTIQLLTSDNQKGDGSYEVMLIETPKEPSPENNRQFLRITHSDDSINICMAINGNVSHGDSFVSGFPQSVNMWIPEYLLPILKQAINSIK